MTFKERVLEEADVYKPVQNPNMNISKQYDVDNWNNMVTKTNPGIEDFNGEDSIIGKNKIFLNPSVRSQSLMDDINRERMSSSDATQYVNLNLANLDAPKEQEETLSAMMGEPVKFAERFNRDPDERVRGFQKAQKDFYSVPKESPETDIGHGFSNQSVMVRDELSPGIFGIEHAVV